MISISTLARRYQPVVFTALLLLMVTGLNNYFTLPAQEDPTITIREAVISTVYPGLSSEKIELLVTKPLELAVRQIPEIDEIRSTSRPGMSIIHAKVYDRISSPDRLEQIWDNMREKIKDAEGHLPKGTHAPMINDDFGDVAVVTAALTGPDYSVGELRYYAQHIRDTLYGVEGTQKVDLHGVQDERIYIEPDRNKISELGFTSSQLMNILQSQNVLNPGGQVNLKDGAALIEISGLFGNEQEIENLLIALPGQSGSVRLKDLAKVRRGAPEPADLQAFYNGTPAIVFAVSMLEEYRVLDYGPAVKAKLQQLQSELPVGMSLDIVTFQADQVETAVYGVTINVLQTLLIVLAVVVMFLGVRTGLIVGSIVPGVMLVTLALMGVVGISLERMSLATMVIALGLLVDNGIVVAEDFKRRLEEGMHRDEALDVCGRELALPLLSSTLTTILVFIPLMLAAHDAGEYTRSISMVVLLSLSASWVLAMTVTPVLCHRFMKLPEVKSNKTEKPNFFTAMEAGYRDFLKGILAKRGWFLVAILICFVAGVVSMQSVSQKFFPLSDRPQVLINLDLPSESTITQVSAELDRLFPVLSEKERFPYIQSYAAYSGYGGPRFVLALTPLDQASNKAFLVVNIDSIDDMPQAVRELRHMFANQFPGLDARVRGMFFGPSDPNVLQVQVQVKGPDENVVYEHGLRLAAELKQIPGMIDVWQDWETPISKLYIKVDQDKARRVGVSSKQIADALSTYYSGQPVSTLYEGDETLAIVARGQKLQRESLSGLYSLNINTDGEQAVPLMQLATIELQSTISAIQREDLTRTLTVEGRPLLDSPEDLVPKVQRILDKVGAELPAGHHVEFDGIITDSAAGKAALSANVPMAIGAIIILLIAQFNGFARPFMIIATIPLIIIGAAIGLHTMGANIGFMVILGLLSLAGIVINNALVLIDRIDIERKQTEVLNNAIISASVRRLRPIIMTTVTTVLGLSPLILSHDPLFYGMSVVMAFGLVVGTVLTLGVTPVMYSLLMANRD